jgi:isopentenyl-diphosphate delta-isomerase
VSERVILVDQHDRALGEAEKLAAHREGNLHRAFSVFVLDEQGRVLLQRRTPAKYHSGGLWSNTCCGHPRPGEATPDAAARRLLEEMGFQTRLEAAGGFVYRAQLGDLVEHEYDHVFVGRYNGDPRPDPAEVDAWRWTPLKELEVDLRDRPERYSVWLPLALKRIGVTTT